MQHLTDFEKQEIEHAILYLNHKHKEKDACVELYRDMLRIAQVNEHLSTAMCIEFKRSNAAFAGNLQDVLCNNKFGASRPKLTQARIRETIALKLQKRILDLQELLILSPLAIDALHDESLKLEKMLLEYADILKAHANKLAKTHA